MEKSKENLLIITPDLLGPVTNGGIGTFAYEAAKVLATDFNVTIIFSDNGKKDSWIGIYNEFNVKVISSDELGLLMPKVMGVDGDDEMSYRIFTHLMKSDKTYSRILLQDWKALGFHIVRAKKLGIAFQKSIIETVFHSPSIWSAIGSQSWTSNWRNDELGAIFNARLNYREKYQIENSDSVIFPSNYMKVWAEQNNFNIPEGSIVLNNPYTPTLRIAPRTAGEYSGLAFFGRLEYRKGLDIFLDSLKILKEDNFNFKRIVLLGKFGSIGEIPSNQYVNQFKDETGISIEVHTDLGSKSALNFLNDQNLIAVHPSRRDNLPYSVVETIAEGIPLIASNVGGTADLLSDIDRFEPRPDSLAECIKNKMSEFSRVGDDIQRYEWEIVNENFRSHFTQKTEFYAEPSHKTEDPIISVIIPYYNSHQTIEETLNSIALQTYQNVEILVANCGSESIDSVETFECMKSIFKDDSRFQFLSFPKCSVQFSRNEMANLAQGEYLIFLDSDNVLLRPDSIQILVKAVLHSKLDIVTAGIVGFETKKSPGRFQPWNEMWLPLGDAPHLSWRENVFGDTFGIFRKEKFLAIGGFDETIRFYEDWAIYLRATTRGCKLDVVPLPLLWYRHRPDSRRILSDDFLARRDIFRLFETDLPEKYKGIFENALAAFIFRNNSSISPSRVQILEVMEKIGNRFAKRGSRTRRIILKFLWKLSNY